MLTCDRCGQPAVRDGVRLLLTTRTGGGGLDVVFGDRPADLCLRCHGELERLVAASVKGWAERPAVSSGPSAEAGVRRQ